MENSCENNQNKPTVEEDSKTNTVKENNKTNTEKENNNKTQLPTRLLPLIDFYKDTIFTGKIGKFKDFQVKLHIDEKVPSVAQTERRIPFALRKKVQAEIEKLEQLDIIEDVTGQPTPWLNPIVTVQKTMVISACA